MKKIAVFLHLGRLKVLFLDMVLANLFKTVKFFRPKSEFYALQLLIVLDLPLPWRSSCNG